MRAPRQVPPSAPPNTPTRHRPRSRTRLIRRPGRRPPSILRAGEGPAGAEPAVRRQRVSARSSVTSTTRSSRHDRSNAVASGLPANLSRSANPDPRDPGLASASRLRPDLASPGSRVRRSPRTSRKRPGMNRSAARRKLAGKPAVDEPEVREPGLMKELDRYDEELTYGPEGKVRLPGANRGTWAGTEGNSRWTPREPAEYGLEKGTRPTDEVKKTVTRNVLLCV